jgi:hypothetical protein
MSFAGCIISLSVSQVKVFTLAPEDTLGNPKFKVISLTSKLLIVRLSLPPPINLFKNVRGAKKCIYFENTGNNGIYSRNNIKMELRYGLKWEKNSKWLKIEYNGEVVKIFL